MISTLLLDMTAFGGSGKRNGNGNTYGRLAKDLDVASTQTVDVMGMACLVATGFEVVGWTAGAAMLGVMFATYRCFRSYFRHGGGLASAKVAVQAAAAD